MLLALKLVLVPLLIGGVTLAGRRWGPDVAGWLSAFPVVSAPILFFIALEQGRPFAAEAASATLSAVMAILVFGLSYAWAALRHPRWRCVPIAFAAYFCAVALLDCWAPPLWLAALAVCAALALAPRLYPPPPAAAVRTTAVYRDDMAWRMLAGAMLVLLVTAFSARLGPRLSGLFAMFPVIASVLAVFSHGQFGAGFVIKLFRSMVLGYCAFACFCLVLAVTLPRGGIATAFALALACALTVQALTRHVVLARARRPADASRMGC